ncbi:glycoside hydrolase family 16 protein [Xylariaceae sp. FL0804]|nr:glycoside hydrolase family 16 protein [Xylariaceae sp. FL0804]
MFSRLLGSALLAATSASALAVPSYSGYSLAWSDTFDGASGASPNTANWNIITGTGSNDEVETYTTSSSNVQLSGGSTVQIVPWETNGAWTSGRIESTYEFTPPDGALTLVEAEIRFGTDAQSTKQGFWPAFWMLGSGIRSGTAWPECGELDVMETVNGVLTGYGTAHCDTDPGGACNEPDGLGGSTSIPDDGWHTWRLVWDNTPSAWTAETITWYLDGSEYWQISGATIGDESVWNTLAHNSMYFILNLAVGGDWPGNPNSATTGGYGAYMEVGYVAQFVS